MALASELICYCGVDNISPGSEYSCRSCKRHLHMACLKGGKPSPLEGDIFFTVICVQCCEQRTEKVTRMKLQWLPVVMLALYNLQLSGTGKRGYYRWKEHICSFIDKHWLVFFGPARKKTQTWHGTVAGTLSTGCPAYFTSGTTELGESGWWKLTHNKPPQLDILNSSKSGKKVQESKEASPQQKVEGLRCRGSKTSIQAAIELKAKRDTLQEKKGTRRNKVDFEGDFPLMQVINVDHSETQSTTMESLSATTSMSHSSLSAVTTLPCGSESSILSSDSSVVHQSLATDEHENSRLSGSSLPRAAARHHDMHDEDSMTSHLDSSMHSVQSVGSSSFVLTAELADQSSQLSVSSCPSGDQWLTERDLMAGAEKVPEMLLTEDIDDMDDDDLEIDPCALSPSESPVHTSNSWRSEDRLPRMEDILSSLEAKAKTQAQEQRPHLPIAVEDENAQQPFSTFNQSVTSASRCGTNPMKNYYSVAHSTSKIEKTRTLTVLEEPPGRHGGDLGADSQGEAVSETQSVTESDAELQPPQPKRRKERENETASLIDKAHTERLVPLTVYEEKQLLQELNEMEDVVSADPQANRLRRKLILREQKRKRNLPLFDLDDSVELLRAGKPLPDLTTPYRDIGSYASSMPHIPQGHNLRILDKFQTYSKPLPISFLNRLIGTANNQLQPIKSPYTARVLKPFIRRDTESRPKKLLLLQEIIAYPHREDPSWQAPSPFPIDYCYVRPEHIPSVNALCHEFFWPGVDLSDCLHYPDFSCVVLYRKFVIGFAFMVPDVKYNEAYISFIFTHPEWQGAGIGSFMLYHLLQTCMGKDVTLHVSASNPAMLLYQKFGFKPEEFCLNFYDKYFAAESTECRHAFFLRLQR